MTPTRMTPTTSKVPTSALPRALAATTLAAGLALGPTLASAQDNVVNLYSARHYQTDE